MVHNLQQLFVHSFNVNLSKNPILILPRTSSDYNLALHSDAVLRHHFLQANLIIWEHPGTTGTFLPLSMFRAPCNTNIMPPLVASKRRIIESREATRTDLIQIIALFVRPRPHSAAGAGRDSVLTVLRGFGKQRWPTIRASDDEREKRAQGRHACCDNAHTGLRGRPDSRIDKVPCYVEIGKAGEDDETHYGDDADAGTVSKIQMAKGIAIG